MLKRTRNPPIKLWATYLRCLAPHATVERLFDLGVIRSQALPELLELKAIFDEQIRIATEEKYRVPFAVTERVLRVYITSCAAIQRALEVITKPHNPYGKFIVNAPFDTDDRKRKADKSSLTSSSPLVAAIEEVDNELQHLPQAEQDDDMDRLNPSSDGGNSV
jgi:hypothetical protein